MATPERGLKWDGTISAGNLIAALVIVVPTIGGMYISLDKLQALTRDFRDVRNDVTAIKLEMAANNAIKDTVADHETRIRVLEGRH